MSEKQRVKYFVEVFSCDPIYELRMLEAVKCILFLTAMQLYQTNEVCKNFF